MTTEEKAKAYDEALEKAKSMIDDLRKGEDILAVSNLESMFPELRESEDERIRKWIIEYFHQYKEAGVEKYANGLKVESIIAWLEKQGEKPKWTEEDESKVKDVIYFLDTAKTHYASTKALDDCITWIKTLKERIEDKA